MNKHIFYILLAPFLLASCGEPASDSEPAEEASASITNAVEIADNTIINLYDAFGKNEHGLKKDFGFSALIKANGKTILFDGGSNADILKANVEKLKIDLTQVDIAIASHAHFDHINGFDYLLEVNPDVKIYFPNDLFYGAPFEFNIKGRDPEVTELMEPHETYFGGETDSFTFEQSGRFWGANVEYIKENMEIAPGLNLIATRSDQFGYFIKDPIGNPEGGPKELGLPELSLAVSTPAGEALIVGCSHSTVETIVTATKEQLNTPIYMLYGGYHLLPHDSDHVIELAQAMKTEHGIAKVAPTHCTGHVGFKIFKYVYKNNYLYAGLGETIQLSEQQ